MIRLIFSIYFTLLVAPMLRSAAKKTLNSADAYVSLMWELNTLPTRSRRLCKQYIHRQMGWNN